jgi:hypothetical protein
MSHEWDIKGRAECCSATGRSFEAGEHFYTLLFIENGGFRREDLCEDAWNQRNDNIRPFSFWRSRFEPPPPPEPAPIERATAEDLLRRFMQEPDSRHTNARYILALMLERKRLLKPIEEKESDDGRRILIYEHVKTGEVFVIPDPALRLDQTAAVQNEVAELLK